MLVQRRRVSIEVVVAGLCSNVKLVGRVCTRGCAVVWSVVLCVTTETQLCGQLCCVLQQRSAVSPARLARD